MLEDIDLPGSRFLLQFCEIQVHRYIIFHGVLKSSCYSGLKVLLDARDKERGLDDTVSLLANLLPVLGSNV